ncbi:MAG: hypothetical protein WCE79_26060 [Xanthobacteraceae bacterium]
MARKKKPTKAQLLAIKIREAVQRLMRIRHPDWSDDERDFLETQLRRPPDYEFSEKQEKYVDRLILNSHTFRDYAGYTVPELTAIAYNDRFNLNEDGQAFVEKLHAWGAVDLKRRQLQRLAGYCRRTVRIGWDPLKDEDSRAEVEAEAA